MPTPRSVTTAQRRPQPEAGHPATPQRRPRPQIGHLLALICVIVFCLFPFYWMMTSSFKNQGDLLSPTPKFLFAPTLENYQRAVSKFDVAASLKNSLIVALCTTGLSLL